MSEDDANIRLGRNPLSSLTDEKSKDEFTKILRNNLISYKARKKCVHLKYSENYKQHYCDSRRSRQKGFLGEDWTEKCRKCYVKEINDKEPEQKQDTSGFLCKILSIRSKQS